MKKLLILFTYCISTHSIHNDQIPLHAWMSLLPDNLSLHQLTIPGTHDSCASNQYSISTLYLMLYPYWKTQTLNITQQLLNGIRIFDIRIVNDQQLSIYHGPFYLGTNLNEVLKEFQNFLEKNKKEVLIVFLKQQFVKFNDIPLTLRLEQVIKRKRVTLLSELKSLKLGSLRNKIILIPKQMEPNSIYPILNYAKNSIDKINLKKFTIYVQDVYNIKEDVKIAMLRNCFQELLQDRINVFFCSGIRNSMKPSVYQYAMRINKYIQEYSKVLKVNLGWLLLDYVTKDLSQHLVLTNF